MGFLKNLFSAPKPPKPADVAQSQIDVNRETQAMNLTAARGNQTTPFGTITNTPTGRFDQYGNEYFDTTQALSPELKVISDILKGGTTELAGNIAGKYGELPDFSNAAGSLTNQMLDRQLAYISPYYSQQTNNLDNALRNQGLVPGTPAYDNAMRTLRQTQNESIGTFINQAQPIAFQQAVQQYSTPMDTLKNFIANVNSISPSPQLNIPTSNMTPPSMAGIFQNSYQNELGAYQNAWNSLGSLASAALGLPTGATGTIGSGIGSGLAGLMGLK